MTVTQATQPVMIVQDPVKVRVGEILARFKGDSSELIPVLQKVQEAFGYLPEESMKQIARFLGIRESSVFGVATFYAQFKLVPTGRNIIKVCRGTGCHVRGAPQLLGELEKRLGVKAGETTPDLEYSLETVACFGSCALAPVVVVNDQVYGRMTLPKVRKLVEDGGA
ncbi:MAG: NADH-quinone oxidoreductase subunit NuoE [Dehalococcoidia bacterium]|nr:NADH-quinone oxidoreductase subunit NuoE [Dehalococcoidia bacterium]